MLVRFLWIAGGALVLWMAAATVAGAGTSSIFLTVTWDEQEDGWTGVWSPADPRARDGRYRALWRKGPEAMGADLVITIVGEDFSLSGHDIQVVRSSRNQRCYYTGRLTPVSTANPRHWQITGTYSCNRGPALSWSARLEELPEFVLIGRRPDGAADERLTKRWREREGEWTGDWVPRDPARANGDYEARWRKGNEQELAFLKITIAANRVTVVRTGPRGRCTYWGDFSGARTVAGRYTCPWARTQPWSATVDE